MNFFCITIFCKKSYKETHLKQTLLGSGLNIHDIRTLFWYLYHCFSTVFLLNFSLRFVKKKFLSLFCLMIKYWINWNWFSRIHRSRKFWIDILTQNGFIKRNVPKYFLWKKMEILWNYSGIKDENRNLIPWIFIQDPKRVCLKVSTSMLHHLSKQVHMYTDSHSS